MNKKIIFFIFVITSFFFYISAQDFPQKTENDSSPSKNVPPKVALVLSGGGANGLAEIPLLEALEAEGIVPDMVLGVSMGAIIGSLYSSGYTPKQIRKLMLDLDIPGLINQSSSAAKALPPIAFNPYFSNFTSVTFSKNGIGSQPGLIGDQKITNMLASCLTKTSYIRNFDQLPKQFRCVSTDVFSGEQIICDSGSLVTAVRGSMSVPMVFSPFPTENKSLAYDGGLSNNLPIQLAKDMGADVVIAMDVLGKIGVNQEDFGTINSSFVQSINLIISANTLSQYNGADILIRPDLSAITAAAFGHVEQIIEIGEKAVEPYKEEIHKLALALKEKGFELKTLDYNRKSLYDSIPEPFIESVTIKDISAKTSDSVMLPKPGDFKYFTGRKLDDAAKKKLTAKLEQLRYTYNLATLTFEIRKNDVSTGIRDEKNLQEEQTGDKDEMGYQLVILANHYTQQADRFFIGGRPSLECNISKDDGTEFTMLPFFTAGIILTDILPVSMYFSSDKYFCANVSYEPFIYKSKNLDAKLAVTAGAKYGALHPQKILTYSTLLADDDFSFYGDFGVKALHAEWMTMVTGINYEITFLNQPKTKNKMNDFSWYARYSADTLQDNITGLDGLRLDSQIKLGTDFAGNLFYSADFCMRRNFELKNELNSFGFDIKGTLNAYPSALLNGYTDFGGFDGMCGYGYGSFKQASIMAGVSYRHILFSVADMPILIIAQAKAGIFDQTSPYSQNYLQNKAAKNPFDTSWYFDTGISLNLALKTPIGNLIFGTGYSIITQKCNLSLGFM